MQNELEKLFRSAQSTSLGAAEKAKMKEGLLAFVKTHPAKRTWQVTWLFSPGRFALASFLLFTVFGIGISTAAEGALPGDLLYPVKTHINERIVLAFKKTEVEQTEWEIEVSKRRLEEAEVLSATTDELTEETTKRLEENFEKQATIVEKKVEQLSSKGRQEAASKAQEAFTNALEIHSESLQKIIDSKPQDAEKSKIKKLQQKVELRAESVKQKRADKHKEDKKAKEPEKKDSEQQQENEED